MGGQAFVEPSAFFEEPVDSSKHCRPRDIGRQMHLLHGKEWAPGRVATAVYRSTVRYDKKSAHGM